MDLFTVSRVHLEREKAFYEFCLGLCEGGGQLQGVTAQSQAKLYSEAVDGLERVEAALLSDPLSDACSP